MPSGWPSARELRQHQATCGAPEPRHFSLGGAVARNIASHVDQASRRIAGRRRARCFCEQVEAPSRQVRIARRRMRTVRARSRLERSPTGPSARPQEREQQRQSTENLRVLCPNCHTQTENFTGKNIGTKYRRQQNLCACGRERSGRPRGRAHLATDRPWNRKSGRRRANWPKRLSARHTRRWPLDSDDRPLA